MMATLELHTKAIIIQKHVRGWLARRAYQKKRQQIVICQAAVRRFLARRVYKELWIENISRKIKQNYQQKVSQLIKYNTKLTNERNKGIELKTENQNIKMENARLKEELRKRQVVVNDLNSVQLELKLKLAELKKGYHKRNEKREGTGRKELDRKNEEIMRLKVKFERLLDEARMLSASPARSSQG